MGLLDHAPISYAMHVKPTVHFAQVVGNTHRYLSVCPSVHDHLSLLSHDSKTTDSNARTNDPMSTGSAHLYHTTHPSSAGEVQHCFPTELRPKEGDTEASAKEAGNKPISSAALPLRCLPTWDIMQYKYYWTRHPKVDIGGAK